MLVNIDFSVSVGVTSILSMVLAGRSNFACVLRRQQNLSIIFRFRDSSFPFGESSLNGFTMCCSNTLLWQKGSKRRNFNKDLRSSKLFWMGVPVRHHRVSLSRAAAALCSLIQEFRI